MTVQCSAVIVRYGASYIVDTFTVCMFDGVVYLLPIVQLLGEYWISFLDELL